MVGLLYFFTKVTAKFGLSIQSKYEDYQGRRDYYDTESDTYLGQYAVRKDAQNGEPVSLHHDASGDRVILDMYGRQKRNLSEEHRKSEMEDRINIAKKRGLTVIPYRDDLRHLTVQCPARGIIYKDMETERYYVVRTYTLNDIPDHLGINDKLAFLRRSAWRLGSFYMDIETGLLVRPTDTQLQNDKNEDAVIKGKLEKIESDYSEKEKKWSMEPPTDVNDMLEWSELHHPGDLTYKDRLEQLDEYKDQVSFRMDHYNDVINSINKAQKEKRKTLKATNAHDLAVFYDAFGHNSADETWGGWTWNNDYHGGV